MPQAWQFELKGEALRRELSKTSGEARAEK